MGIVQNMKLEKLNCSTCTQRITAMKRCRLKRTNFQIINKMSKENKTSDKQENGNEFIAGVSSSINDLLAKFDNGLELYQNNAVFANCIEHLLRGGDVYKILEQIIVMQSNTQKRLKELIESGALRQEIIVSKERFDELASGL